MFTAGVRRSESLFSAGRSGGKLIASGLCCCWSCIGIKTLSAIYSEALQAARSSWVCLAPRREPGLLIFTVRAKHITSEPCRKLLPGLPRRSSRPKRKFRTDLERRGGSFARWFQHLVLTLSSVHSWRSGSGGVAERMTGDRCVVLSEHSQLLSFVKDA